MLGNKLIPEDTTGGTSGNSGYKWPIAAAGLVGAIGVPAVGDTWASAGVYTAGTGSAATGLHALIGAPAKVATGNLNNSHKGPVAASGLHASIGTPSIAGTTLFAAIGAPAVAGTPIGGTDGTLPAAATANTASTGLYKHVGDPAAAAIDYAAAVAGVSA